MQVEAAADEVSQLQGKLAAAQKREQEAKLVVAKTQAKIAETEAALRETDAELSAIALHPNVAGTADQRTGADNPTVPTSVT